MSFAILVRKCRSIQRLPELEPRFSLDVQLVPVSGYERTREGIALAPRNRGIRTIHHLSDTASEATNVRV